MKVLQTTRHVLPTALRWHLSLQCTVSLFHCSASLLSANVVHSGSSVNYSTSQEGRGTWWWGLGAGSQTIKPASRPPALFTAIIPAQFHCFLPVLCVSCPFRGSKGCCCSSDKHESRPGCSSAFVLTMKTLEGRKKVEKQINNLVVKFNTGIIWVQSDTYQIACGMHYTV